MPSDVVEAWVTAPLVPDDQPKYLAWDWHFKLRNGDAIHLRHGINMESFLEADEATIRNEGNDDVAPHTS